MRRHGKKAAVVDARAAAANRIGIKFRPVVCRMAKLNYRLCIPRVLCFLPVDAAKDEKASARNFIKSARRVRNSGTEINCR